jgi:beta-phosphoglucomutase-like phosphatase (HAD superfamily)
MQLVVQNACGSIVVHANLRALFLDLDGTLFDTFPLHWRAVNLALADLGCEAITWETYLEKSVRLGQKITSVLTTVPAREFYLAKDRHFLALAAGFLRPRDGAKEFLETIVASGIPVVVVTTARRASVDALLSVCWDLPLPDAVVTWEDTPVSKPHAAPYMKAGAITKVPPEYTVAIEDSPIGSTSALTALATTIVLSTDYYPKDEFPEGVIPISAFHDLQLKDRLTDSNAPHV